MPDIPIELLERAETAISQLSPERATELRKRHFPAAGEGDGLDELLYEDYAYVLPLVAELLGGRDAVRQEVRRIRAAETNEADQEDLDELLKFIDEGGCVLLDEGDEEGADLVEAEEAKDAKLRPVTSAACKQAIVAYCAQHQAEICVQFDPPLPASEFAKALQVGNWKRINKAAMPGGIVWRHFDCKPLDDQLRAEVEEQDGRILSVLVDGE